MMGTVCRYCGLAIRWVHGPQSDEWQAVTSAAPIGKYLNVCRLADDGRTWAGHHP